MFFSRYIKRYFRYVMRDNPIKQSLAERWYTRTSLLYFFFAWNVVGYIVYKHYNAEEGEAFPGVPEVTREEKVHHIMSHMTRGKYITHYGIQSGSPMTADHFELTDKGELVKLYSEKGNVSLNLFDLPEGVKEKIAQEAQARQEEDN